MTYEQALLSAKGRISRVNQSEQLLALACSLVPHTHPAVNPRLLYEGASKQGLTHREVQRLAQDDPVALCNLMFC